MSDSPFLHRPFLAKVAAHPEPWLAGLATEIAVARVADFGAHSYEEVWLAEEGETLKVANIPFFLYGIAPADLVTGWEWIVDERGKRVRVVTGLQRRHRTDVYRLLLLQAAPARTRLWGIAAGIPGIGVEWSSDGYAAIAVECGGRSARVCEELTRADADGVLQFENATAEGLSSF